MAVVRAVIYAAGSKSKGKLTGIDCADLETVGCDALHVCPRILRHLEAIRLSKRHAAVCGLSSVPPWLLLQLMSCAAVGSVLVPHCPEAPAAVVPSAWPGPLPPLGPPLAHPFLPLDSPRVG